MIFLVGFFAIPQAFADVTVTHSPGSSTPGCEETNSCFIPSIVTIQPGDIVTWKNTDNVAHSTISGTHDRLDGVWNSSLMMVGESYSVTLDDEGTYPYFCLVHPWMKGTVIVGDPAAEAPPFQPPPTTDLPLPETPYWTSDEGISIAHEGILQLRLNEYWKCAIGTAIETSQTRVMEAQCVKNDDKHVVGISPTVIAKYRVEKDATLTFTHEDSNINPKLEKFRDQTLHQHLWDIYTSITPKQILSEVVYFVVYTDDYGGDEIASVIRDPGITSKFDLYLDPVDMVPSGIKINKQLLVDTLIHENAHILSLNSEQGNNDALIFNYRNTDLYTKKLMERKHADCAPNYYNDMAGCLYPDSNLNLFFQKFWAEIYPEHHWRWEFNTTDEYYYATVDFYQKYNTQFVTYYAGIDPDEDFAESFMAFVLKEKPSQHAGTIPAQKILFFYKYSELVEMRDFIRSAIATSEFCDNGTVWQKDSFECQKYVPPPQQTQEPRGGGCLIATAAFGSEMAPQVQFLREIRDNTVLQTESGSAFMTGFNQFYYSFSPTIADYERGNPAFKEVVKLTLTPLLTSLTLLQYADIDSESEMLGYGIGIILLNIGMYFIAPAVLIMKIRKRI